MKIKVMALLVISAFFGFLFIDKKRNDIYFGRLAWESSGVIESIVGINKGRGVVKVRLVKSNLRRHDFDPNGSNYCVIKWPNAWVIENNACEWKAGDSLVVSCKKDSVFLYRRGLLIDAYFLHLVSGGDVKPEAYRVLMESSSKE